MGTSQHTEATTKVFYLPIEAAIRWSGLTDVEEDILEAVRDELPRPEHLDPWPSVRLQLDRIFDGMRNGELPYGVDGITVPTTSLTAPDLTVRHIDLRQWLSDFYPSERPAFLFDAIEAAIQSSSIYARTIRELITNREALRTLLDLALRERDELTKENRALQARLATVSAGGIRSLDARAETTYLNIIGSMLGVLLTPSGADVRFGSQEQVIATLLEMYPRRPGITQRTLWAKFAAAKRQLASK